MGGPQRLVAGALAERSLSAVSVQAQARERREEMDRVSDWMGKLGREGRAEERRQGAAGSPWGEGEGDGLSGAQHILQLSAQQQEVVRGRRTPPLWFSQGAPGAGRPLPRALWHSSGRAMGKRCHSSFLCPLSLSLCRCVPVSLCTDVTVSLGHRVTGSPCHCVTVSLCHCVPQVELCAPTGRAAQNLSEATGMEAKHHPPPVGV